MMYILKEWQVKLFYNSILNIPPSDSIGSGIIGRYGKTVGGTNPGA